MRTASSSIVARTIACTSVGRAYGRAAGGDPGTHFSTRALEVLGINAEISDEEIGRIPSSGALVVVANHPFGAIDGLLLISLLARLRCDVKLLANSLLRHIPELRPNLLEVDVFSRGRSVQRNGRALRQAMRWLDRGGSVVIFPAGEVAHRADMDGTIVDSAWRPAAAELAVRSGAAVVPFFFAGSNSRLFRSAGRVHPLLRTALLPHEMWAMRGRTVSVRIGAPVLPEQLSALPNADARTALLRACVDRLADRAMHGRRAVETPAVAERGRAHDIEADVEALQADVLLESGSFQVFCAPAARLPAVLPEIGRLRELAFRQVGEGTGLARDLDRFDERYQHLFVWDRSKREVAGAYRLGATDIVAPAGRVESLYTRTLFEYDAALLAAIGPALELGRSFVQPLYQRDFSPLLLLWKGISRVVARAPRYRRLFGVVSISDRYDSTSRQLLLKFLQTRRFDDDLARLVRAKNPPPPPRDAMVLSTAVATLEGVSALVRRIERDGKDIPVLLRQYLKLNARLLGFTVDRSFGNVLDGLIVVDLAEVEPALLSRYMGKAEARGFLEAVHATPSDVRQFN